MVFQDARDYQIAFLASFLLLGIGTRDWTVRPEVVATAIATCLITQWLATSLQQQWHRWRSGEVGQQIFAGGRSLRSALITSLGLSLLLRVDHLSTMAIAASVAILSKFLLRIQGKHFFNPANVGIIAVLLLTHDAWVSPGQWGDDGWYALLFLGAGGLVLQRVGRWDTSATFLAAYAAMEAVRNIWLGWTWDVYGHRLMSGSLLLFALFMITDPRSIPNAQVARLLWAIAIAGVTFGLRNYFFVSTAMFWALFALAPLTPLLDWLWAAPRFVWSSAQPDQNTLAHSSAHQPPALETPPSLQA